jgi:hypothetical protein
MRDYRKPLRPPLARKGRVVVRQSRYHLKTWFKIGKRAHTSGVMQMPAEAGRIRFWVIEMGAPIR